MTFIAPHYLDLFHARQEEASILAVTFFVVIVMLAMFTRPGRRLLRRALRRVTKAKLRFTTRERSTVWFGTMERGRYLVSLKGIWNVANASRRDVVLKTFYVKGLSTEHHILSACNSDNAATLIPGRSVADVEIFCLVKKTFDWRADDFIADVCFVDDGGDVHTIKKARFVNIKQAVASATSLADNGPYSEGALSATSR
jgi:hypothetical protein